MALDSIAGGCTAYEQDQDVVGDVKVGEHAKLMTNFYRNIIPHLEPENAIFVATNQLREQIGGMGGFGTEKPEALIGGEAQRFNSTYQFKMVRISDNVAKDAYGVERKCGSTHTITVKRNKLGREGNMQKVTFTIHINGGIDWYTDGVKFLGENYKELVTKTGGWYTWNVPGCKFSMEVDGELIEGEIDTTKKMRDRELGLLISQSPQAKEYIRKAFGIIDMPEAAVIEQIEKKNKTRRKKKSELDTEED